MAVSSNNLNRSCCLFVTKETKVIVRIMMAFLLLNLFFTSVDPDEGRVPYRYPKMLVWNMGGCCLLENIPKRGHLPIEDHKLLYAKSWSTELHGQFVETCMYVN